MAFFEELEEKFLEISRTTNLLEAILNNEPEVVKYLVENGVNLNVKDFFSNTPLHHASKEGLLEIIKILVEHGADVHAKDKDGRTSLHLASRMGHIEVVKYLVEHGADVHAINNDGKTALDEARSIQSSKAHLKVIEYLKSVSVEVVPKEVQTSRKEGADATLNIKSMTKQELNKVLLRACKFGHMDQIADSLENGADVNARDIDGRTPLHWAIFKDTQIDFGSYISNAIYYFIKNGAEINAKDNEGRTALHLATHWGHLEVVQYLVENGANVNAKDCFSNRPIHLALHLGSHRDHIKIVEFLVENGANVNARNSEGKTVLNLARLWRIERLIRYLENEDMHT